MRYELSDFEWAAIKPFLPNKSRGVRRVNDRRVLNGNSDSAPNACLQCRSQKVAFRRRKRPEMLSGA